MRLGVLTGGGDCPGLNAVIRAIVRKGETVHGDEIVGFLDSWDGVLEQRTMPLTVATLRGMLPKGGTLLGARRGSPYEEPDGVTRVQATFNDLGLDALIVIGGNGSLTVSSMLYEELGLPILGVPKTIDNDVVGTDVTFGFHTAVQIATDAIDRLHSTAEAHDRVMVVEVMGRQAGWIATYAGIAGGATAIVVPEVPFEIDDLCELLRRRHARGRYASIVVVAEGATSKPGSFDLGPIEHDRHGHAKVGGVAAQIAPVIEERTGFETRVTILGYLQRGGTPTAYDRVLATRYGLAAVDAAHRAAESGQWGEMVALRNDEVVLVPMSITKGKTRTVDLDLYRDVASIFFG